MAKTKGAKQKIQAPKGTKRKAQKPSSPPPRKQKAQKTEQDTEETKPAPRPIEDAVALLTSDELARIRYGDGYPFNLWDRKIGDWLVKSNDEIGRELRNEISIRRWVDYFGVENVKDVKHLSDDQKKKIISSLDGWCVQIPWNSLLNRFPFCVKKDFTKYLLCVLIEKDIVTKMYDNPFWYLDGKKGPDDEEGDETFGQRLKYLLDRFVEADPGDASLLRSDISRLANGTLPCQVRSGVWGKYHAERRTRQVEQWAADFIASEPACWLLRQNNTFSEQDRHEILTDIYRWSAEKWAHISSLRGNYNFYQLPDLGKTFNKESGLVKRANDHVPPFGDESVEGMRILLVVCGGIRVQWENPDQGDEFYVCAKASVLAQEKTMYH
ncbi:hypothetical protein P168DRAFT_131367 [Aspergillus campestris IBT 28561]|uniref:Uncharacterized protein n=1 Tax=Aspergillus campestris (strain IBT 28561) TaxID=1392248 RepID=A0A2I1D7J9_ASPC2|nr:uncharacterized protein P168DRAFT_131367 [Aspergillus campestris IBT 28561]PKY05837.1 hypothetical protein P168DRAFT_131367 [Aspergillus campestris IBT 28561]